MSEGNWPNESSQPSGEGEFLAPLQIGNYHLVRRLGEGGMGIVYEAVQDRPQRHVALKIMRQAIMTHEQVYRFEREWQYLGRLVHPNIAQVYEAGTHKEGSLVIPFYAMELVPDAAPVTAFADKSDLSRRQRIELMLQICSAIQYAHEHAVLHRDLKPSNILVSPQGTPKVIDLGVSRLLSEASLTLTRTDQLVGTIQYMAPEQVSESAEAPSARSDVYSLGVVLYELVVRQLPYRLPTDNALRAARMLEAAVPARPRTVDKSISKDLESVILKALARDPRERYSTVESLIQDLQSVLNGGPVHARAASLPKRLLASTQRRASRNRAIAVVIAVVLWYCLLFVSPLPFLTLSIDFSWPAFALSHLNHVPDVPLNKVAIISVGSNIETLAKELGETTFDPKARQTIRPILGRLVERLTIAKPRVIAMDYTFRSASAWDERFLSALRDAEFAGVPIVVGAIASRLEGGPGVMQELVNEHRVALDHYADNDWGYAPLITMFIDEVNRDEPMMPACILAAANGIARDAVLYVDYNQTICAQQKGGESKALAAVSNLSGGPNGTSFERGIAYNLVEVPAPSILAQSEFDLADVLRKSDSELRALYADKVVIIGDDTLSEEQNIPYLSGHKIRQFRLLAVVVEHALNDTTIRWPRNVSLYYLLASTERVARVLAFAILATLSSVIRSRRWQLVFTVFAFVAAIAAAPVAYQFWGVVLNNPTALVWIATTAPVIFIIRKWARPKTI